MDVREKASSKKRLIDANALGIGRCSKDILPPDYCAGWNGVINLIEKAPTIDAVPVVRCRECQHWKPSGSKAGNSFSVMEYIGGCEFANYYRSESDFCSYGERKEGAE